MATPDPDDETTRFREVCAALGVDPAAVASDSQEQHVVAARARVTARLKGMGWPAAMIARHLARSLRTIQRVRPRP